LRFSALSSTLSGHTTRLRSFPMLAIVFAPVASSYHSRSIHAYGGSGHHVKTSRHRRTRSV